jgi:hypothetical protein
MNVSRVYGRIGHRVRLLALVHFYYLEDLLRQVEGLNRSICLSQNTQIDILLLLQQEVTPSSII